MAFDTLDLDKFHLDSREDTSKSEEETPTISYADLTVLTDEQRITLAAIVLVLCILSIFGNLGALYANKRRKLRVFFRTCLISLALSDLITTVFMVTGYLAQFEEPSVQIWCIGGMMCKLIPFVTTGAILVSSFTLLGIATERYFAVMGIVLGVWKPTKIFCLVYCVGVWGLSFAISSPMYMAYSVFDVYIISSGINGMENTDVVMVELCISEKESNAYYYVVVLAIIFVPTLVAFVWLNSIIANKLWIRRHSIGVTPSPPTTTTTALSSTVPFRQPNTAKQMKMIQQRCPHPTCDCQRDNKICSSSILTVPTSLAATTTATRTKMSLENNLKPSSSVVGADADGGGGNKGNSAKHISSREARHLRMFTIVLILMGVFIFFRLPAWIFLIFRMYGTYTRPVHWILHFSFGILTLASCVLNPLLYTFLAETIQYAIFLKAKLCGLRRYFGVCGMSGECCLWCSSFSYDKDNEQMSHDQIRNQNDNKEGDNCNDDDGRSNDGAKNTSRRSDDDSVAYIPLP